MINNIRENKYQRNDAIGYEPEFDTIFSLLSGTKDPLPVVIVRLRRGKKQIATTISVITLLWDIRATSIMIKRKHTKHYKRKIWYNKVDYSTAVGLYCTTHDVQDEFLNAKVFYQKYNIASLSN